MVALVMVRLLSTEARGMPISFSNKHSCSGLRRMTAVPHEAQARLADRTFRPFQ